jgi:hypothetical protein
VARCRTITRLTAGLEDLTVGLRAWAAGLWCLQAAVELLIGHRVWLRRADFRRCAVGVSDDGVWLDLTAAAAALEAGGLACASSDRQVLLLAASLAEGVPIDLCDAVTGLDASNAALVVAAVAQAAGHPAIVAGGAQ